MKFITVEIGVQILNININFCIYEFHISTKNNPERETKVLHWDLFHFFLRWRLFVWSLLLFSNRECLIFDLRFSQNTYIRGPFHALQRFSWEMKVNVWFSVEAKESDGPSACGEQERSVSQRRVGVWMNSCGFYLKRRRVLWVLICRTECQSVFVFHC